MTHIFLAAGDLAPDRDDYDESYVATRDVLHAADIAFAQLETSFAEKGVRLPQARHAVLARPDGADALARAGFDVISMAGNHVLDWGNDAFFETKANLERVGRIAYEGSDEVATYVELRYTWDPQTSGYRSSRRITGEVHVADPFRVAIKQLVGPVSRYGLRRKVVETTVVHDANTATKVLVAQAARYGQPSRVVQYIAPQRYGWLRRGDLVTLTDVEIAAQAQVMLVEGITWGEDATVTLTLRYIETGA